MSNFTPAQARNEIARRKANRARKAKGQAKVLTSSPIMNLSGPELHALAGTPTQAPARKRTQAQAPVKRTKRTHPRKGKSALTAEQQAERKRIYDATRNGQKLDGLNYRQACAAAGIPTGPAVRAVTEVHPKVV